jgi:transposase
MKTIPCLGIDIAKQTFVAVLWFAPDRQVKKQFDNTGGGFKRLKSWLAQHFSNPVRAGLESTSTSGEALCEWLASEGHTVHLLNPQRLAHYAQTKGRSNKTDPADGSLIAEYIARHPELRVWQAPPPEQKALRGFTRVRAQLVRCRRQLQSEIDTAEPAARLHLQAVADKLDEEIAALEKNARKHINAHPALQQRVQLLMTCKSIGFVTAAIAVAELPDITADTESRSIAKWAGLNPCRQQSGSLELPTRISHKGNQHLRNALYMPALVAKQHNPLIRAFAERLKAKGKSPNAILGAISHKLLRILIGMLKTNTTFDANYSPQKI